MKKAFLINLGCPKNQVDGEHLLSGLQQNDIYLSSEPEDADVILVNTCSFIEDAKRESIETIFEASKFNKKLVVFGCLPERYMKELKQELSEVNAFFGVGEERKIIEYLTDGADKKSFNARVARPRLDHQHYAYLKIAEGCNNACTYCVIPSIRGPYKSIASEELLKEAHSLISDGVKELILVAQDTTNYGIDLPDIRDKNALPELIKNLCSINGLQWLRLLYTYPSQISDELINTMAREEKVCKYLDIPLQHSSPEILKKMGRKGSGKEYLKLIEKIRKRVSDIVLRTSLIVGFPGETENDFKELLEFVKEAEFERLGVFAYSKEEGTAASRMKNHIPGKIKEERREELMALQADISYRKNISMIGKTEKVLIDEILPSPIPLPLREGARGRVNGDVFIGRYKGQAPEIDGVTLIELPVTADQFSVMSLSNYNLKKGDIVDVKIKEARTYDLIGEITPK